MASTPILDLCTNSPAPRSTGGDPPLPPRVGLDLSSAGDRPPLNFGLTAADAVAFGGDLRVRADGLLARHRDAAGRPLGWEHLSAGPGGRVVARYARGVPKGLVHTATAAGAARIVLTEGAAAAAAARVLTHGAGAAIHAGLGGHWNDDVARLVAAFARRVGITEVEVAFSDLHAAGRAMAERALEELGPLDLVPVRGAAPAQGWVAALLDRRAGGRS